MSFSDLLHTHNATLDLDRFAPWSWWITPRQEPRRYDTRFLLTLVTEDEIQSATHDNHETVQSGWFSPARLIERADSGERPMAPPTWWTLRELSEYARVELAFAACRSRPQHPIEPILRGDRQQLELLLPGHPEHPAPAIPGLPPRIHFHQGRWWAQPKPS